MINKEKLICFFHMIFNFNFTPLSETDSKPFFLQKQYFSVELLGVFIPLILIEGVIILILHKVSTILMIPTFNIINGFDYLTFVMVVDGGQIG